MTVIQERLDELREYLDNFPPAETDTDPEKALKRAIQNEIEYLEKLPH